MNRVHVVAKKFETLLLDLGVDRGEECPDEERAYSITSIRTQLRHALAIVREVLDDPEREDAMGGLAFVTGILWARGVSLDELSEMHES